MKAFVNGVVVDVCRLVGQYPQTISSETSWVFIGGIAGELIALKYRLPANYRWHKDIDAVALNPALSGRIGPYCLTAGGGVEKIRSNQTLFNSDNIKFELFGHSVPNFIAVEQSDIDSCILNNREVLFIRPEFWLASQLFLATPLTDQEITRALALCARFEVDSRVLAAVLDRTVYSNWISSAALVDSLTTLSAFDVLLRRLSVVLEQRCQCRIADYRTGASLLSLDADVLAGLELRTNDRLKKGHSAQAVVWRYLEARLRCLVNDDSHSQRFCEIIRHSLIHYAFSAKQELDFLNNVIRVVDALRPFCAETDFKNTVENAIVAMATSGILHHYCAQHLLDKFQIAQFNQEEKP